MEKNQLIEEELAKTVEALIRIFRAKLCQQPPMVIVRIYSILTHFLEENYNRSQLFVRVGHVRLEIFRLFLCLRASEDYNLGLCNDDENGSGQYTVHFSPHVVCRGVDSEKERSEDSNNDVTFLSLTRACMLVIRSLREERDWNVLKMILHKVSEYHKYVEGNSNNPFFPLVSCDVGLPLFSRFLQFCKTRPSSVATKDPSDSLCIPSLT